MDSIHYGSPDGFMSGWAYNGEFAHPFLLGADHVIFLGWGEGLSFPGKNSGPVNQGKNLIPYAFVYVSNEDGGMCQPP